MNYQSVLKNTPLQGFRTILSHLEEIWQEDYLKAPVVTIQLRNAVSYSGIVTKFGFADKLEMVVLFSSNNSYNSRYTDPDTCNYILFSEIIGLTVQTLSMNNLALQVVTQNKMAQGNSNEPLNKLGFLRLAKDSGEQISSIIGKEINITADEIFYSIVKDYAVAGNYMNNIVKAFSAITADTMGKQAAQEKVNGIELMPDKEFSVKILNNKLRFFFNENDLSNYYYTELDFKKKIEALL